MPGRNTRMRKRSQGCLSYAIGMLIVAALVLAAAIVVTNRMQQSEEALVARNAGSGNYVDADAAPSSEQQLVLNGSGREGADTPVELNTPTPEPTAEPTATPKPTLDPSDPYAAVRPTPTAPGFLPVFKKADTDELRIAITLDDCSGATITTDFARLAYQFGAKLTLFPSGNNVMKLGMDEVLRKCVFELGYEVENRCYSDSARLYRLSDSDMASEIWKQSIAVSYVLGGRYHPHFLRLYGGNGENDQRTHAYLIQQGYLGIASWTAASNLDADKLVDKLQPGGIYSFKTDENDARKMGVLMQAANAAGYEMVTLNELFGFEPNEYEQTADNVLAETMPELQPYDADYYFMKQGDRTWAVGLVQRRLEVLGYLPSGSADGIFGESTADALTAFQANCGLAATGAADPETQRRLFADDAPMQYGMAG